MRSTIFRAAGVAGALAAGLLVSACQQEAAAPPIIVQAPSALEQGMTALRMGDYARAAAWCRQAAGEVAASPQAFACLGDAELGMGNRAGAEAAWLAYLDRVPNDVPRRHALARFYMQDGRYPQAQNQLDRVSQMGLGTAETFFLVAEIFRVQGQCQPALGSYQQSLRLDASYAPSHEGMQRAQREICPRMPAPAPRPRVQDRMTGGGAVLRPGQW
ncbi:tetratricopeptide repeat protein [Stella sp.]|uniref:tetratricopeptide repeat protein n=1 Tax=Stella sp. TaxID=2912054 RepID=UPI0035B39565